MDTKFESVSGETVFEWRLFLRQVLVSSTSWTFFLMFGLSLGSPTVIIAQIRRENNSTSSVSDDMASWISSVLGYAAMVWVFGLTIIAHFIGRKKAILILATNTFVAFTILYCSKNATHVLISQIFHGMTSASQTTTSIMVLTEYTSPKYRGMFLTIKSATLFWGMWIANIIGTYSHYSYIGMFGVVCSVYNFISILLIPESPYWLAYKERYEDCAAAHRWLKGSNENSDKELDTLINTEKGYSKTRKPIKTVPDFVNDIVQSISKPEIHKPVMYCLFVLGLYYFSGKLICAVYSLEMLTKITNNQSTAYAGMLILDGFTVLGMYIGCGLSKILNRRTLLLSASIIGTSILFIMSFYLYLVRFSVILENKYISITLLTGFSISICCGPMIMASTISGELIPLRSRSFCLCLISFAAKFVLGTLLKVSPLLFSSCGFQGTFLFYACTSTIFIILVYKYVPETKDKSLHEIAGMFNKKPCEPVELELLSKSVSI